MSEQPLILIAVLAVEVVAGLAAGLGPQLLQAAKWAVPFALAMLVINVLVTRDGATVLFRGPHLPWAGQVDFTLEARLTALGRDRGARHAAVRCAAP